MVAVDKIKKTFTYWVKDGPDTVMPLHSKWHNGLHDD